MAENMISLKGLDKKCENILSQDQIGLPKPHVFSKKCENHVPNELNRHKKKCEKIYNFKLILPIFETKTYYFQSSTRKLQFLHNYQMYP